MDSDIVLRLLAYVLLLVLSGFFSGSETALFSIGPVQLLRLKDEQHPRVELLHNLLDSPRRLIATIFIGNELVNIGASVLMASATSRYLEGQGPVTVATVSTGISVFLILLFGEITPKNLAAKVFERWALMATRPIWFLALLMTPLRWAIERIADAVIYLVGDKTPGMRRTMLGEDEFLTMVEAVKRGGQLDAAEQDLIERVFAFGDRRVSDVMTKAPEVFLLSYNLTLRDIVAKVQHQRYSRIPIFQGAPSRVVGVLHAKDLIAVAHGTEQRPRSLMEYLRPPYFVPRGTKCEQLLREFKRRRTHMALVVDEHGGLAGLVTMDDLLQEMFGEIKDEKEVPPPGIEGEVAAR
jgi:putative hemolysin